MQLLYFVSPSFKDSLLPEQLEMALSTFQVNHPLKFCRNQLLQVAIAGNIPTD
jgi:hypothetical protein